MVELLGYLEANGFANYIASGGGRDFMRPISHEVYGIPRERVIGSASALEYVGDEHGGTITRKPEADYLDDGPQKPIRIWSRIGRRPRARRGQLQRRHPDARVHAAQDKPFLPLLVLHDDADREFAYTAAPSRRSSGPTPTGGPWSASGTTGPPSSRPERPVGAHGPPGRSSGTAKRDATVEVTLAGHRTQRRTAMPTDIGPVQLFVMTFEHPEFKGRIAEELDALRSRGDVRIVDSIVVLKDAAGEMMTERWSDLEETDGIRAGTVLAGLIGLELSDDGPADAGQVARGSPTRRRTRRRARRYGRTSRTSRPAARWSSCWSNTCGPCRSPSRSGTRAACSPASR